MPGPCTLGTQLPFAAWPMADLVVASFSGLAVLWAALCSSRDWECLLRLLVLQGGEGVG